METTVRFPVVLIVVDVRPPVPPLPSHSIESVAALDVVVKPLSSTCLGEAGGEGTSIDTLRPPPTDRDDALPIDTEEGGAISLCMEAEGDTSLLLLKGCCWCLVSGEVDWDVDDLLRRVDEELTADCNAST